MKKKKEQITFQVNAAILIKLWGKEGAQKFLGTCADEIMHTKEWKESDMSTRFYDIMIKTLDPSTGRKKDKIDNLQIILVMSLEQSEHKDYPTLKIYEGWITTSNKKVAEVMFRWQEKLESDGSIRYKPTKKS